MQLCKRGKQRRCASGAPDPCAALMSLSHPRAGLETVNVLGVHPLQDAALGELGEKSVTARGGDGARADRAKHLAPKHTEPNPPGYT